MFPHFILIPLLFTGPNFKKTYFYILLFNSNFKSCMSGFHILDWKLNLLLCATWSWNNPAAKAKKPCSKDTSGNAVKLPHLGGPLEATSDSILSLNIFLLFFHFNIIYSYNYFKWFFYDIIELKFVLNFQSVKSRVNRFPLFLNDLIWFCM